jgi:hypothetical protein
MTNLVEIKKKKGDEKKYGTNTRYGKRPRACVRRPI